MPKNTVREFRNVMLRMGVMYVGKLDNLCVVNKRSRRELIEMLVDEAYEEVKVDPDARITPL